MTLVEELWSMFPPNEGLNSREGQHQDLGAKAADRINVLEAALRRCNEIATDAGNDQRHTEQERTGARMVGASIRKLLREVGL